jgi:arsenite methyltransferase
MSNPTLLNAVRDQYAAVARSELSNESAAVRSVAEAFGYSADDLASLPPQANMGLSCGNPVALAGLRAGEVVVDLGCGGGLDVLLAAKRVGPTGKAVGIDMTPEMIERAKAGAAQVGAENVEFHLARIDQLPLPDASVDCIISNCVINLVPDKDRVFQEMMRVLKPGGRVAISDIALKQPLPEEVRSSVEAYVGCIGGAILIDDYQRRLQQAGFEAVVVADAGSDLNAYAQAGQGSGCCGNSQDSAPEALQVSCCGSVPPPGESADLHSQLTDVLSQFDANAYAAGVRVHAVKGRDQSTKPTENVMSKGKVEVYDKPMCCSTGVCGPDVDPVLPRFAADLDWLKSQGHRVERFNLAQQPEAFLQNRQVQQLVTTQGTSRLPAVVVDEQLVSAGKYPTRDELAAWPRSPPRSNRCRRLRPVRPAVQAPAVAERRRDHTFHREQ